MHSAVVEPANALCVCRSLRERKEQLQQKADKREYSGPDCTTGCGLTLAECALILVTFHEPKNFSPTCKMLIHFQVDFCGPFGRVAWTGFLSLTCRAEASLAFTVRKPESSKQVGTEAGAAAAEADSQMPTKQNVSFWGWHKKKGAGVGTFPFPLTLSLSHLAHPPFAT